MSIDVHAGSQRAALHHIPDAAEGDLVPDATWAETTITVLGTIVTILVVSAVAVLMAMA